MFWRWFSGGRSVASGAQVGRLRTQLFASELIFFLLHRDSVSGLSPILNLDHEPQFTLQCCLFVSCRQVNSVQVLVWHSKVLNKTFPSLWKHSHVLLFHRSSECWYHSDSQIIDPNGRTTCDNQMYSGYETWLHALVPTGSMARTKSNLLFLWCWNHWQRRGL